MRDNKIYKRTRRHEHNGSAAN